MAKHSTTINAGQFTGYLANLVREAGGGAGMTDKQIVQNASADHFRILKEASQPQKPSASDKGSSRGK